MTIITTVEVFDKVAHVAALQDEIEVLKSKLKEYDTGHIKTAISVLENRVKELNSWIVQSY